MKNILRHITTCFIITFSIVITVFAKDVSIMYNGHEVDCLAFEQPATIKDGRTLVPVRAVFETLGATINWDDSTKTVRSTLDNNSVSLSIGSNILKVNDSAYWLDVPAQIYNNRTMIPLRAVAQAYGVTVDWDSETKTVYLSTATFDDNPERIAILDSGMCGENLTWTLYSDGLLKISGTGRSYDYCKGLFGDKVTRAEIEAYQVTLEGKTDLDSIAKYERGFQEGKIYDDKNGQYVAPWYKYRQETDFTSYTSKEVYDRDNPNGWTYNRIEIEPGITYIGNWFFYRVCGPTELIIPDTVTEIGQWSIRYSPTLKSVYLPDSIVSIEKRGCSRLEALEHIRIGNGLKNVGEWAFAQNDSMKAIIVNSNFETEGKYLFGYCKNLEYVEFTALENLKGVHFVDCNKLKKVVFSNDLINIDKQSLVNRQITTLTVPENVKEIGQSAFYGCTDLKTVYIDSENIAKNLKYSSSCGHLVAYATKIYIRKDIDEIGNYLTKSLINKGEVNGYILYETNH